MRAALLAGSLPPMVLPEGVTGEHLRTALATIVDGHEVLRTRLDRASMTLLPHADGDFLTEVSVSEDLQAAVGVCTGQAIDSLDPERGRLLAAAWLRPSSATISPAATSNDTSSNWPLRRFL